MPDDGDDAAMKVEFDRGGNEGNVNTRGRWISHSYEY